jgi:RNA polymerase sigma factor (sigma-70 family)
LYDRYKDKVYSYIWNILNYNKDDASNVLSDVFIKIFEYLQHKDIKQFKTLIYSIAHNACIDRIRQNKSAKYTDDTQSKLLVDKEDGIEKENLNTHFKQKLMMEYLSQIEEKFRNVLYLYYYEEKSYDEIAEII